MHDLGARLVSLVDGFNQVSDLNADGVARNVMIKVHIEEVAGHRRASAYGKSMLRRRRESRSMVLQEEPASVLNECQSGHDGAS
jgi:hypothetical protein